VNKKKYRILHGVITLFVICLSFLKSEGQAIKPPAGFKLLKADGVTRQIDHYVKDGYTFMSDAWTGPPPLNAFRYDTGVAKFLSENYRTSLGQDVHFYNGIYYGIAHYNEYYIFIVLDGETVYKFSSKKKDAGFEKYSNWLLTGAMAHDRD
jgi:hypothetical protein